jgi:hypothetical protein
MMGSTVSMVSLCSMYTVPTAVTLKQVQNFVNLFWYMSTIVFMVVLLRGPNFLWFSSVSMLTLWLIKCNLVGFTLFTGHEGPYGE